MKRAYFVVGLWFTLPACGSDAPASPGTAGSASSGGSGASGGSAGASGGATGGGGAGTAGSPTAMGGGGSSAAGSGAGGKMEPGSPCVSNCPSGPVSACFGVGCPLGECDNSGFHAAASCSSTYSGPASTSTVYCNAGENRGYCLQTIVDKDFSYWAVTCVNGTPQVVACPDSCGVSDLGVSSC